MEIMRADQVGSLLRPPELIQAWGLLFAGQLGPEQLEAVEDRAIEGALEHQRQFVDPEWDAWFVQHGLDKDRLLDEAIAADNSILDAARDGGAVTGIHLCRGNGMGAWLSSGGYDAIAQKVFGLHADRLLLEYDTDRAGTFEPLRNVPADKVAVLGLVSTKVPELESQDDLRRRIDAASAFVPMEQLAISPQCGFASDFRGNPLTEDDQWRKLDLVISVAEQVWGRVGSTA